MLAASYLAESCPYIDKDEDTYYIHRFTLTFTYREDKTWLYFMTLDQATKAMVWLAQNGAENFELNDDRLDDHCCRNCTHNKDKGTNSNSCVCELTGHWMYNIDYAHCSQCFTDLDGQKLIDEDKEYWNRVDWDDRDYYDDDYDNAYDDDDYEED